MEPLLPEGALIDVGSGAGLPGIVLAVLRADPVTLLEAEGRRAAFLERAVEEIGGDRSGVRVIRTRAEEAGRSPALRETFNAAVARALAEPPVALEYCLPFVRPGGRCVLQVGPSADVDAAARAARELSGGEPNLAKLRVPGLDADRRAMIVVKEGVISDRYPRRTGVPAKHPLG